MKYLFSLILFLSFFLLQGIGQSNPSTNWKGEVLEMDAFSFTVKLQISSASSLSIQNAYWEKVVSLNKVKANRFEADFGEGLKAEIRKSEGGYRMFIKSGFLFYHISLQEQGKGTYFGQWDIWMTSKLEPVQTYLVYETGDNYRALYPFFQDHRFTGTWATNFQWKGNQLSFRDMKSGILFQGEMSDEKIGLDLFLAGEKLTHIDYYPYSESFRTGNPPNQKSNHIASKDPWGSVATNGKGPSAEIIKKLEEAIYAGELPNAHSVLIAQNGKLLYEKYFFGFHPDIFHDQRSASKSISSAMIGIAIKEGLLKGVDQKLYDFIPEAYQYTRTAEKTEIQLHHLLHMASGLDAIDFGIDRISAASEGSYQSSDDWLKTVLEAPMIYKAGEKSNYGSANPYLLGIVLDQLVDMPLEWYMDAKLFEPLGISQYVIQSDDTGKPYFGGGIYLRPRDMLSFGQLYLNKGKWKGVQIFSEDWAKKSLKKYGPLLNANEQNEYGYFFWHKDYQIEGKTFSSIDARGAGGQYIMILPEEELLVVMTSGNYRNGLFMQPENIMQTYILPALIEEKK